MFQWGEISAVVTSGSVTSFLDAVNIRNISLKEIRFVDDLNIRFKVRLTDYSAIRKLARKRGDDIKLLHSAGGYYFFANLLKRPVILFTFLLWIFLVVFLPSRILFFSVEGNQYISDYEILSAAQQCGVQFGTSRRHVKSEKVKNALLSQIDRLKWVGVNTKGCVATISVKEGAVPEGQNKSRNFGNIVASADGVITDVTVISGTPLCKAGQAVRKGQVLVSGYTDCGLYIKSGEVSGEVFAVTRKPVSAVVMRPEKVNREVKAVKTTYSVQIGKNIIKLMNNSGILGAGCVKMYERKDMRLPGGFNLPVSLIKETEITYETNQVADHEDTAFEWVEKAIDDVCLDSMVAGEIIQKSTISIPGESGIYYSGYYICKEMIGQVRTEELLEKNGERNG